MQALRQEIFGKLHRLYKSLTQCLANILLQIVTKNHCQKS